MNYFVIQVKTKNEEKYISLAKQKLSGSSIQLIWPRRKLTIKKKGIEKQSLAPIFPGYIFIESDNISSEIYWILRKTTGFFRFLKSNSNIVPISIEDKSLLAHFLSYGEIVDKSNVYFDENKQIQVVEGPMKGLEGRIIKVDKRKKRAKVELSLYEKSFFIDFGFEVLQIKKDLKD